MSGWIGVDLDGTLAIYYSWSATGGWNGGSIGMPVARMVMRVQNWLVNGHDVRIFTARAHNATEAELQEIRDWCLCHIGQVLPITCQKDPHMIELWDDRAVQVRPNTGERVDGGTT